MLKRIGFLLFAAMSLVALSPPVRAGGRAPSVDFAATTVTVPAVTNLPGLNGAFFRTRVVLLNPTSTAFSVQATFYETNGAPHTATVNLGAGELKVFQNVLDDLFGMQSVGTLVLDSRGIAGGSLNNLYVVNTEVYTTGPGGRFGTTVPSVPFSGSGAPAFSPGIFVDSGQRTNVACYNDSSETNSIQADVLDGSNHLLQTLGLLIAPHGREQQPVTELVNGGYVRFRPSLAAVCLAVVVNNSSNDGHLVLASEYLP